MHCVCIMVPAVFGGDHRSLVFGFVVVVIGKRGSCVCRPRTRAFCADDDDDDDVRERSSMLSVATVYCDRVQFSCTALVDLIARARINAARTQPVVENPSATFSIKFALHAKECYSSCLFICTHRSLVYRCVVSPSFSC